MELTISNTIKNFIKDYSELINNSSEHKELVRIANEVLHDKDLLILFVMLKEVNINLDDYRWEIFDNTFLQELSSLKQTSKWDNPSKSWSRLDYLLDGIGYQGFTHSEIVDHLMEVKDKLGIKMEPLEFGYGWEGPGDYDLGWFDKEKFKEEYPEEFED